MSSKCAPGGIRTTNLPIGSRTLQLIAPQVLINPNIMVDIYEISGYEISGYEISDYEISASPADVFFTWSLQSCRQNMASAVCMISCVVYLTRQDYSSSYCLLANFTNLPSEVIVDGVRSKRPIPKRPMPKRPICQNAPYQNAPVTNYQHQRLDYKVNKPRPIWNKGAIIT